MLPVYGQVPKWADPVKLEQKEVRKAASWLSFAAVASVPLSFLVSLVTGVFMGICGINVNLPEGLGISGMPPAVYYLLSSMLSFLTIVMPFCLVLLIGKRRLTDTVMVEKTGIGTGLLLVFAGLLFCILMNYPANLISAMLEEMGLNGDINTDTMVVNSTLDIVLLFVAVVLVAPVTEEFAYRAVTMAGLRRWGVWPAAIFSAVIFACAHFSFQALPVVLTGGLVMALLYAWTRNIWINIFVHFLNNLIATLPIAVEYYFGTEIADIVSVISAVGICGLGFVSLIVLIVLHATGRRRLIPPMDRGFPVRKKVLWLFVNPGFIAFFVVFIGMAIASLYAL